MAGSPLLTCHIRISDPAAVPPCPPVLIVSLSQRSLQAARIFNGGGAATFLEAARMEKRGASGRPGVRPVRGAVYGTRREFGVRRAAWRGGPYGVKRKYFRYIIFIDKCQISEKKLYI